MKKHRPMLNRNMNLRKSFESKPTTSFTPKKKRKYFWKQNIQQLRFSSLKTNEKFNRCYSRKKYIMLYTKLQLENLRA